MMAGVLWSAMSLAAFAEDRVVRNFPNGSGFDAVGMVDAGDETEIEGPQALVADPSGSIMLLDQNNGRVLSFDPSRPQEETRSLELPPELNPSDLVVVRDTLFVWDNGVHALTPSPDSGGRTRSLSVTRSALGDPELAADAFAQMGTGEQDSSSDPLAVTRAVGAAKPRLVSTRGAGDVLVATETQGKSAIRLVVRPRAGGATLATLSVRVRDRLGSVELMEVDTGRRLFVLAENVPESTERGAAAAVLRFGPDGQLQGMYELPLAQSVALSRRFLAITPDGAVFFLKTRDKAVEVVEVGFTPLSPNAVMSITGPKVAVLPSLKGINAAVRRPTRKQVIETALAYESFRWRVTPATYGGDPDRSCSGFNRIRRPGYLSGRIGQEVTGVPYCWGCFNNLSQISARVVRGDLAGNVCTRDTPRQDVLGVDCSAFVSATWGLSSHFTTLALPGIATPLSDPWELQPGDALNKPGSHVVLFLRFTADRKAEVIEASPSRCNGRVCRSVYPLSALLARGFTPIRYRGLAAEVAANAVGAPAPAPTVQSRPDRPRPGMPAPR